MIHRRCGNESCHYCDQAASRLRDLRWREKLAENALRIAKAAREEYEAEYLGGVSAAQTLEYLGRFPVR